jgi:formylglycine-generating enzyme required for sulfatase activity
MVSLDARQKRSGMTAKQLRFETITPPPLPSPDDSRIVVRRGAGGEAGKPHYILPPLARVAAGPFEMGSNQEETTWNDEYSAATKNKRHKVDVAEFWISQYPVTNAEYQLFVAATGATAPDHWRDGEAPAGLATHPVVNVSWYDARAYCDWLSEVSGRRVRLPTEAEWEKAARWDAKANRSRVYPWDGAWDADRCNSFESSLGTTTPVGLYPDGVSQSGLFDAAGNVWEWTLSKFKNYPYQANDGRNEIDRSDVRRVVRGGSWYNGQDFARCAYRNGGRPDYRHGNLGFRWCCLSPGSGS